MARIKVSIEINDGYTDVVVSCPSKVLPIMFDRIEDFLTPDDDEQAVDLGLTGTIHDEKVPET